MSDYTPGPWDLCNFGDYGDFQGRSRVIIGDDMRLAVVQVRNEDDVETNANACLIGAAPDLLDAIQLCMTWIRNWDPEFIFDEEWPDDCRVIEAAIAKAKAIAPCE